MLNRKFVSFLTVVFLIVLVGLSWLFISSQAHIQQAQKEAVKRIEVDYTVKDVKKFYWTTIKEAYFAMEFVDDSGQAHYAVIAREGGDAHYYTPSEIITEDEAKSIAAEGTGVTNIMQARLGMMNDGPVWEVTIKNEDGTLTYYYVNAKDGAWIQKIENI